MKVLPPLIGLYFWQDGHPTGDRYSRFSFHDVIGCRNALDFVECVPGEKISTPVRAVLHLPCHFQVGYCFFNMLQTC